MINSDPGLLSSARRRLFHHRLPHAQVGIGLKKLVESIASYDWNSIHHQSQKNRKSDLLGFYSNIMSLLQDQTTMYQEVHMWKFETLFHIHAMCPGLIDGPLKRSLSNNHHLSKMICSSFLEPYTLDNVKSGIQAVSVLEFATWIQWVCH